MAVCSGLNHDSAVSLGDDELLIAYGIGATIRRGIPVAYFSGRMPGYHHYSSTMTPEEYYAAKDPLNQDLPLEKQFQRYERWGMKRIRLVPDGFAADWKSAGFGVLFRFDLPFFRPPIALDSGKHVAVGSQSAMVVAAHQASVVITR